MNLGSILDGCRARPAVTHPVRFRVGGTNSKLQKTSAVAEACLVYVSEEERAELLVEAARYLARQYPGTAIPPEVQSSEETLRFMAVALRDRADPAVPFCDQGPDQLRAAVPLAVLIDLTTAYREFREREYPVEPSPEDEQRLKEQAAGK